MPEVPPVLLAASFQHEIESREEWDPQTILVQPYEVEQAIMPDIANCLAVKAYLKMLELPFSVENRTNAEHMSPTGKVPFIKCGHFVVAELEPIVDFVKRKGYSLTGNWDTELLNDMRAYMSLVNTVFGNAENYIVWCDPDVLPLTKDRYGSVYPFPINHWVTYLRKSSCTARLKAVDWLKKSIDEVYAEVDRGCKALSDRLGGSQYFFKSPTELDALVFAHVYTILTTAFPTNRFAATVRGYDNLIQHCTRIEKLYFNFTKPRPTVVPEPEERTTYKPEENLTVFDSTSLPTSLFDSTSFSS